MYGYVCSSVTMYPCKVQAWLSSQLRVVHIAAGDVELASLLRHYAARQQNESSASRAQSPAIAQEGPDGTWQRVREVRAGGAILVRPDGHVGWRCSSWFAHDSHVEPASLTIYIQVLSTAVKRILYR